MSDLVVPVDLDQAVCVDGEWSDLANLTFLFKLDGSDDFLAAKINEQTRYLAEQVESLRSELRVSRARETKLRAKAHLMTGPDRRYLLAVLDGVPE